MDLFHLSFIWADNRFPAFFEIVTFSQKGQIINRKLSKCKVIVSMDNKSVVSTTLKKEVYCEMLHLLLATSTP